MTRRSIGLALLTGGTLLTEVALTRALSISLFHHLAFLVVSTALLGTAAAGTAIAVRAPRDADRSAGFAALAFSIAVPLCFSLAQLVELEPLAMARDASQLARLALVYLLLAAPFFCSGIAVASLLDRFAASAPRLYAADLLGAGAGSFFALFALSVVGSRGALLLGAMLGAGGALLFLAGRARLLAAALVVVLASLAPFSSLLPLRITSAKVSLSGEPFDRILRDPARTKRTEETSIARIDLVDFGKQQRLFIDAGVAAIRIPPPAFRPHPSDATLPYELRPNGRALIVGSGAGWEIAEALAFGAANVDGVEISEGILRHTPESIARDPRVRLIHDEGRTFLERAEDPYDAIVMIHTISNAATSAGALHLAEDYLLTVEAMQTSLDRLTERGLLFITRPEAQLPRLLTTIVAALDSERPSDHILAWTERAGVEQSFYAAVIVGRSPLADSDRERILARIADRPRLRIASDPLIGAILTKKPLSALEELAGQRLDPPTDDRPFFHQRRRFIELGGADLRSAFGAQDRARLALEDQPFAELSAILLLIETTLIGGVLLLIPILISRRSGSKNRLAVLTYFSSLGLGFMLIEIALIQRLSLLLGQPAVSFATVFAGLLVGAGMGSRISERFPRKREAPALAAIVAIALALLLPLAVGPALALPLFARIAIALLLVLPAGIVLGMPFPLGLLQLQSAPDRMIPWAFAANGVASIAGTVLALILATEIGFTGVLLIAAALYASARATFSRLGP